MAKVPTLKCVIGKQLVLAFASLLCCAASPNIEERALSSDRALVRSPDGDVFVIEYGKKRRVPDLDTEEAILALNRAKRIQSEVIQIPESKIRVMEQGRRLSPPEQKPRICDNFP